MLPRRVYFVVGISFLIIGFIFLLFSLQPITGFVVLTNIPSKISSFWGIWFLLIGITLLMAIKFKSKIHDNSRLVKLTEEATNNQTVQREIDHLIYELSEGNTNPGLGTRHLYGRISYLRGRHGGRVFYRPTSNGYEILAKASKDNEEAVIKTLRELYINKKKKTA